MIGRTNAVGGSGGTLTVTAPAGVTVTVTKDGKTKTKVAGTDGVAVFKGLSTGDWTVTITDGTHTASKTVTITLDYAAAITFFTATLHITYPAGAACAVTNGDTILTAPDTSGIWECTVTEPGDWIIRYQGKDWQTLSVTEDKSTVNAYPGYLYYNGNQCQSVTGGWTSVSKKNANIVFNDQNIAIDSLKSTDQPAGTAFTANSCNIAGFSTLRADVEMIKGYASAVQKIEVGVSTNEITSAGSSGDVFANQTSPGIYTISADLSGLTDTAGLYPYFMVYTASGELYQMWVE